MRGIEIGVVLASLLVAGANPAVGNVFPPEANGWHSVGQVSVYDRESIFSYMNGAAEFYLSYDFVRLLVREYAKEGAPEIVAELYEMASSEEAFGVFHHDPGGERPPIGQMAAYRDGELKFWAGKWMGRLSCAEETAEVKAAILNLGRGMARCLPSDGRKPELLDILPVGWGRVEESLRYFHTRLILNRIGLWLYADVLGLSRDTQCATAEYSLATGRARLLVVSYPGGSDALAAHSALHALVSRETVEQPPVKWLKNAHGSQWMAAVRAGSCLAICSAEHLDEALVAGLINEMEGNIKDACELKR